MPLTLEEVARGRGVGREGRPRVLPRRAGRGGGGGASGASRKPGGSGAPPPRRARARRASFALLVVAATCWAIASSRAAPAPAVRDVGARRRARRAGQPRAPTAPAETRAFSDDDVDETLRVAREALKLSADALENAARIARDRPAPLPPPRVLFPLPPRGRSSSGRPADPTRTETVSSAGPPPRESPRLVVGVPTAPRAGDVDYLTRALETILRELPDPAAAEDPPGSPIEPFGGVRVIVMNTKPGRHVVFSRVRARFEGWSKEGEREAAEAEAEASAEAEAEAEAESRLRRVAAASVSFVDSPGTFGDPTPNRPDPDDLDNPTNVPGAAVRRQTADLATLLALAADVASAAEASSSPSSSSSYFLFLEDDFATCPGMLAAVRYLLAKSTAAYPEWLGVRFSYGMNGVVVRVRDAAPFARYLASHVSRLPADLLWREWTEGRREDVRRTTAGRGVVVYRYNLMEHVGEVSTFAVRPERPRWPRCYEPMSSVWSLGRAETFDEKRCAESDVSPCGRSRGVDLEKWRGGSPGEDQFPWLKHAEDRP